jgi:hypothetical protein
MARSEPQGKIPCVNDKSSPISKSCHPSACIEPVMPITVSIVEEDARTRDSLWQLINREQDFNCASQHATGEDAFEKMRMAPCEA